MIDLSGIWSLTDEHGEYTCDYPIPGDVHSALLAAGLIPDPYVGRNELIVRPLADRDWTAARTFHWDGVAGEPGWYLDIDFLDTVAEIRVNGELVLSAANCFLRYRPDVSKALTTGENRLEILFKSNTRAATALAKQQPYKIPYSFQNCPIPDVNMLRKPQCHFGWDWNIAIAPFGLYGRIELRQMRNSRIESVQVRQTHNNDGSVDIEVEIDATGGTGGHIVYEVSLDGQLDRSEEDDDWGHHTHWARFHIEKPRWWWPAGQGDQPLYDLTVKVGDQIERRKIGLRKIELLTDKDDTGARFAFRVNGREIFMKGANWIPADALPSRATPELTERLLRAAVDANMNMIRVWGGGFYEQDWFYDLCDRLGLLVWQDFMFSCSLYPSDDKFLAEVSKEVDHQVRRLGHHACLALWCGDNELLGALTWFEESRKNRDRYLVGYDRLNRTIEQAMRAADPIAIWWPSSPSPGLMNFGDAWHDDRSGDMHFWSVWHEGRNFEHYRDVTPRFCSEFGFQSFPSLPAIQKFAKPRDMNISTPVMESHQKNAGGNARIAETMFRYFRFPMAFADFVYLSQVQQGLAIRTAVDYWRSLKPHCMGTLYWQLNDTWPVASWSGLDHGGAWKLMHYMARDFFAPVAAVAIPDKDGRTITIRGINDLAATTTVEVSLFALSVDGQRRELGTHELSMPPDRAVDVARLDAAAVLDDALLYVATRAADGDEVVRHFAPRPYKTYDFADPAISVTKTSTADGLSIILKASRPAYFVALECDAPGHFSHAAFDLLPGQPRAVQFRPTNSSDIEKAAQSLIIRDLYSATCR